MAQPEGKEDGRPLGNLTNKGSDVRFSPKFRASRQDRMRSRPDQFENTISVNRFPMLCIVDLSDVIQPIKLNLSFSKSVCIVLVKRYWSAAMMASKFGSCFGSSEDSA